MAPSPEEEPEARSPRADLALVRAFLARRPEAVERLSKRLRCLPLVLRVLNARAGRPLDEHELADVVQDVAILVLRKLDRYDGRAPLDAWVYAFCRFELWNAIRRHRRRPVPGILEGEEERVPAREPASGNDERAEELRRGLSILDDDERAAIEMKHYDELTFEEIGARTGLPTSTVKTRYYRGLVKLEQFLAGRGAGRR